MKTLTVADIRTMEPTELSEGLWNGSLSLAGVDQKNIGVVAMLLDRLVALIGAPRLRNRVEHLEQVVRMQQMAINLLINQPR